MQERMEGLEKSRETPEILPVNFGVLVTDEALPILDRASRRIDILHPRGDELWRGIQGNVDGLKGWIEAGGKKLQGKSVRAIAGGAFVVMTLSACSGIDVEAKQIYTDTPQRSVATEFLSTPSTTTTPSLVEESPRAQETTISELATSVKCVGPNGECVTNAFLIGTDIMNASVSGVSTGEVQRIELKSPVLNEVLGTADIAQFVTRDKEGNPQIINVVVQLIPSGGNENEYAYVTNFLAGRYEDPDNKTPYTQEELERYLSRGTQFGFGFSTRNVFGKNQGWVPSNILGEYYQDNQYVNTLQNFLESNGSIDLPEDLYIFPTEVGWL